MKIGAIVQARMGSQRFPGKVLYRVSEKPMLLYLLERLDRCRTLDTVIVATSTDDSDLPIVDFCGLHRVTCFRGSQSNVASRFGEILDTYPLDGFVRVSGDSPLLDQRLVDRGIDIFVEGKFEIVTNVFPRTYPSGQSVEVLCASTFKSGYKRMREAEDLEHVTPFFYKNAEDFRIFNFASDTCHNGVRMAVDTDEEMKTFARIVGYMDRPHWQYGLTEILQLYRRASDTEMS